MDIPLAVVDAITLLARLRHDTATPVMLNVHADHLGRPVKMTNSAKASVWDVTYTPWGAPHTLTGAQTLNERFPFFWPAYGRTTVVPARGRLLVGNRRPKKSGLHYNWHRHYDLSLGRYTQPDPLGFVDGPSVYGYVRGRPLTLVDFAGLYTEWTGQEIKVPQDIPPSPY